MGQRGPDTARSVERGLCLQCPQESQDRVLLAWLALKWGRSWECRSTPRTFCELTVGGAGPPRKLGVLYPEEVEMGSGLAKTPDVHHDS